MWLLGKLLLFVVRYLRLLFHIWIILTEKAHTSRPIETDSCIAAGEGKNLINLGFFFLILEAGYH